MPVKCKQCAQRIEKTGLQCKRTASCQIGCTQRCWQHSNEWRGKGECRKTKQCDARFAMTIGNGVEVRPSQIRGAGNGLFVTRAVKRGDAVTEYDGRTITRREADALRALGLHTHVRTIRDGSGLLIDGLQVPINGRGGASFANDARGSRFKYNVKSCLTTGPVAGAPPSHRTGPATLGRVWLVATEPMKPGTEVFFDYGEGYWR